MGMKNDTRLSQILTFNSCLGVIAVADSSEEVSQLIDLLSGLNVKNKHLTVNMSSGLETELLQKKRLDYNVVINHSSSGAFKLSN